MVKRILFLLGICAVIITLWQTFCHSYTIEDGPAVDTYAESADGQTILFVPLDSRPPCRQWVEDLGRLIGCQVVMPPSNLLDYYSAAGDTDGVKAWVMQNIGNADVAILSIDQLLSGGLLAARERTIDQHDETALLDFLRTLHAKAPNVPLYAFGVLPRLQPPDNLGNYRERQQLVEYSRLVGRKNAGFNVDEQKIAELTAAVAPEVLTQYRQRYTTNTTLNEKLAQLAKERVITELILGQDDGEPYGSPNIEVQRLKKIIMSQQSGDRVTITHGADELALMILARITQETDAKVYVHYADPSAAWRVMPYMAINMRDTVGEKLAFLQAKAVASPKEADFILVVNAANSAAYRTKTINAIKEFLAQGQQVAVVDLSVHFRAEETLLPLMLKRDVPINALIAYAGWNTASNSVGTALAQSVTFVAMQKKIADREVAKKFYVKNMRIVQNRIIEDNFYLKNAIDEVNGNLKKIGFANTADLDWQHNYRLANFMLQCSLAKKTAIYKESRAFRQPFYAKRQAEKISLFADGLTIDTYYPWPRTFEIYLETSVNAKEQ